MQNFNYYAPTQVVFGKQTEAQVGELVAKQKAKKVLIHYGSGSVIRSGLLDCVKASLQAQNIAFVEVGGVVPNPRLSLVYQGLEVAQKENVDFILAVGGGSVIDSAKAIGYGLANEGDLWDFYEGKRQPQACTPVGVILTLAAAGSEMSEGSVITKDEGMRKRACNDNLSRPKFVVMNPELTMSLPDYQTSCGVVDILMHTMERYFVNEDTMTVTDTIAEGLMRTVMHYAKDALANPKDYRARAEIMWAGSLSHNGLTSCGGGGGDWSTHLIEHELSGLYDVAHGAGLATMWGSWARYVMPNNPARFAQFAQNVLGVKPTETVEKTALLGIEAMEDFYRSINMPTNFDELGIKATDEDIAHMARNCAEVVGGETGAVKRLREQDIVEIYRMARG